MIIPEVIISSDRIKRHIPLQQGGEPLYQLSHILNVPVLANQGEIAVQDDVQPLPVDGGEQRGLQHLQDAEGLREVGGVAPGAERTPL